ncbi:inactive protein RESTRICTED TEV MOVEMENT 2-like [Telopea speciosissima]|uniref:inactive protein RESTRICTED TEV MOVEMENT 2-like n=1 Tax=Telopea speciosissima TaxID=54955 RepID=UPI001CC6584E|nr:inactive protein RESTRICTED TEV MOVEMENT 2-like [Telopea speciosissima]
MAATPRTNTARVDSNFDPSSEWIQEEGSDTLAINLPGFKKEEIRVQLNAPQNLKITGERNLGDNKWSRFEKNVKIPDNCDVNGLKAKFDNGFLYIIMPSKITPVQPQVQTIPTPEVPPSKENKPANEPKPQIPPKTTPKPPPSQKSDAKIPPETALQKPPSKKPVNEPASQPPPSQKPETKIPPETALQKPSSKKPVSETESQPPPSRKPVTQPETPVQLPKPTLADQQINGKVDEPTITQKAQEKEKGKVDGYAGESERNETAKGKEGGDDGVGRVKDSTTGSGVGGAATVLASDLTMGLYGPKQLIVNVVVGFKKDQLRVQVDSKGNLKISGQRFLEGNRWSRFEKDFRMPENFQMSAVHSKLVGGLLYVIVPKKISEPTLKVPATPTVQSPAKPLENNKEEANGSVINKGAPQPQPQLQMESQKSTGLVAGDEKKDNNSSVNGKVADSSTEPNSDGRKVEAAAPPEKVAESGKRRREGRLEFGVAGGLVSRMKKRRRMVVNVAVAIVVVALGIYATYKFRSGKDSLEN